jgi:hypothetical protein
MLTLLRVPFYQIRAALQLSAFRPILASLHLR